MAEESELLACPLCGGRSIEHGVAKLAKGTKWRAVTCTNCQARTGLYRTSEEAIAAWDRRTPTPVTEDVGEAEALVETLWSAILDGVPASRSREDEWRPIETAPKDGSNIDLWVVFPAHDDVEERAERYPDSHWSTKYGDWRISGFTLNQYAARPYATHWRPLPAAPTTKRDG